MAMEKNDITLPVRRLIRISTSTCHKLIQDYPHAFIICIILFLLHKLFPSLFLLFLSYSPVFALTSLLLGALLYYGEKEPNFHEIVERELNKENNNSQTNTEFKSVEDRRFGLSLSSTNDSSLDSELDEKDENFEKEHNFNEESRTLGAKDGSLDKTYSENNNSRINAHGFSSDSESDEKSENNISQNRLCETERFKRLTSLIERRRARMSIRHEIKRSLIDPDSETLTDDSTRFRVRVSPIMGPKWNPNDDSGTRYQSSDQNEGFAMVPGSAPSVLLHRSPFEPIWNRNRLTGQKRVSRLDPFLVTEMDKERLENSCERRLNDFSDNLSMNENDQNMLDFKNEFSIDEITPGKGKINDGISILESEEEAFLTRDLEQNSANIEGENANSYSDTILLSEFLNLCSSKTAQPIKDQIQIESEPEPPFETTETLTETTEANAGIAPDEVQIEQIEIEKNVEDSELESVKEITSILKQIREEAKNDIPVSKGKDESNSIETGQTGLSESEMVSSEQNGNLNDETGLILEETGRICEGGLKRSPLSNSISWNLKKLRKQNKAVVTSSSSSNSD